LRRIKTQLLHLVGLISLLKSVMLGTTNNKKSDLTSHILLKRKVTLDFNHPPCCEIRILSFG